MKIFGHPLHMMLIHFPSALLPMDFVCSLAGRLTGNLSFVNAAFYALTGAVIMGWLAIIAGAFDLIKLQEQKSDVMKKALVHAGINLTVLTGFSLIAYAEWKQYPHPGFDSTGRLIVKGSLIALLIIGNFRGGSLVLKDGVGRIHHQ